MKLLLLFEYLGLRLHLDSLDSLLRIFFFPLLDVESFLGWANTHIPLFCRSIGRFYSKKLVLSRRLDSLYWSVHITSDCSPSNGATFSATDTTLSRASLHKLNDLLFPNRIYFCSSRLIFVGHNLILLGSLKPKFFLQCCRAWSWWSTINTWSVDIGKVCPLHTLRSTS